MGCLVLDYVALLLVTSSSEGEGCAARHAVCLPLLLVKAAWDGWTSTGYEHELKYTLY